MTTSRRSCVERCIDSPRGTWVVAAAGGTPTTGRHYRRLHFTVPVLGLEAGRSENVEVPFAAAPRLDDLSRDDVDEDLREGPAFGIPFQVVGGLVPAEAGVKDHRQEQVVAVVHD